MTMIKVGIVGCGKQASKHITSLKRIPNIMPVLADIDAGIAQKMADQEECGFVEHPDALIDAGDISALVICTPTQTHVPVIRNSFAEGIHVFCEKPLSDDLQEIEDLKPIVDSSNLILQIGYIYRYVPAFEEGARLLRHQTIDGESLVLGRPLTGYFRLGGRGSHQLWKHNVATGGGAINEMLVHMIDLATWYFGPLDHVESISNRLHLPERVIGGETHQVDAEDFILVRCSGKSGVEVYCQADLVTPAFTQYVEIQCQNGTFRGSIQPDSPSFIFVNNAAGGYDSGKTVLQYGQRNLLDIQMTSFVHSVLNNKKPDRNTIEDSLALTRIIDKIRKGTQ